MDEVDTIEISLNEVETLRNNNSIIQDNEYYRETLNEYSQKLKFKLSELLVFVTITIKPKLYKYQSTTQYELTFPEIRTILHNTSDVIGNVELTNDGNIHYHAIVLFQSKLQRISFLNTAKRNRSLGFVKITPQPIETIEQLKRSLQYLIKDLNTTKKVLHTPNYKPLLLYSYRDIRIN